ncbi:hypothetical protein C9928_06905, partial [Pseudidiomarina aestuarii]
MNKPLANVAFVSFNFGKGYGGHYLSLAEAAQSSIFIDPIVIDLGFNETPLLDQVRSKFIQHRWFGHAAARKEIRTFILDSEVKIVFCYDIASFNIVRMALRNTKINVVYVKCGGPILTLYYPRPNIHSSGPPLAKILTDAAQNLVRPDVKSPPAPDANVCTFSPLKRIISVSLPRIASANRTVQIPTIGRRTKNFR